MPESESCVSDCIFSRLRVSTSSVTVFIISLFIKTRQIIRDENVVMVMVMVVAYEKDRDELVGSVELKLSTLALDDEDLLRAEVGVIFGIRDAEDEDEEDTDMDESVVVGCNSSCWCCWCCC